MGTPVDHLEVAPRMWDKTIAASYLPQSHRDEKFVRSPSRSPVQSPRANQSAESDYTKQFNPSAQSAPSSSPHAASLAAKAAMLAATAAKSKAGAVGPLSFFTRFKAYIIPAIFIICLLIVAYILWKYFTKYRNTKIANGENPAMACPFKTGNDLQDPLTLIQSEDMSKYEVDSDEDDDDIKKRVGSGRKLANLPTPHKVTFPILPVESDKEDEEDEDEDDDEEDEDDTESSDGVNEDDEGVKVEKDTDQPDLAKIEKLIMNASGDMPLLEDDDAFSLRIPSYITEITDTEEDIIEINSNTDANANAKSKRPPRKTKPITL